MGTISMCEYMYTTCTHVCIYMHIICILKEKEAFNFAVSEVGMGDMRGVEGGDMSRVNGRDGMGGVVTFLLKWKNSKKSKVDSTDLPRDELFACLKWKSIYSMSSFLLISAQMTFQLLQLHQVSIPLCYSFIAPFSVEN